jgi:cellulose synthase/poly-beta-1,6-N-acetylglucosamine synthase-like glycosyltransferase
VTVVPGAIGAWRREAVLQVGGYREDTLAEDTDLTWRLRKAGWRVEADNEALGFTEAPETLAGLFRQRFRWTFGTLQCLWKHRDALGRYGWFGCVLLPSLWLFQIVFQALAPLVDLQVFWALAGAGLSWLFPLHTAHPVFQETNPLYTIGLMYGLFFLVELACSFVAFRFDRERMRLLWSLFWQRFAYRQLMYLVLLKSVLTALQGIPARWMKVERMGTAKLATG